MSNRPNSLPPTDALAKIGLFFVAWSHLDYAMELAIWHLNGWRPSEGYPKTGKEPSGRLLKLLTDLQKPLPEPAHSDLDSILRNIRLLIERRNLLAHAVIQWHAPDATLRLRKTTDQTDDYAQRIRHIDPHNLEATAVATGTVADALLRFIGMAPPE
ncbi:hypothetical protein J5Y09_04370 [Roseomonas sp. PWR1]|uniref:Uncharacterized protein n=1 Tax=Roseomonas nitratireducens TaxID=2820810 RepID=A0ABS4AP50_9PROT|nr:hypothetical protein [Neoroseomonas nitratireducens]MBP0463135.1 hypothetical protein [Neoroseomonas nitratireducens]